MAKIVNCTDSKETSDLINKLNELTERSLIVIEESFVNTSIVAKNEMINKTLNELNKKKYTKKQLEEKHDIFYNKIKNDFETSKLSREEQIKKSGLDLTLLYILKNVMKKVTFYKNVETK